VAEEKFPPEDDERKDNPFEEFINRDLGMESVLRGSDSRPADDDEPIPFQSDDSDDDPSEGTPPRYTGFGLGSGSRFGTLGGTPPQPDGSSPFSRSSPFGSRPFGSSAGNQPPRSPFSSSGPLKPSGNSGTPNSFTGGFSRFTPSRMPPPARPRSLLERVRTEIGKRLLDEIVAVFMATIVVLIVISTMLYIDNLRMNIALRDGQISELRTQIEELQRQLAPTSTPEGVP
jgi:hypothetical protein